MAATQALEYQQIWTDGLNRGDVSVADQAFARDCVIHVTGFQSRFVESRPGKRRPQVFSPRFRG